MSAMSADLELSVLSQASDARGYVAGLAVTDQVIVALGGSSQPMVVASSNARDFVTRNTPKGLGLRDVLAGRRLGLGVRRVRPARRVAGSRRDLADGRDRHPGLPVRARARDRRRAVGGRRPRLRGARARAAGRTASTSGRPSRMSRGLRGARRDRGARARRADPPVARWRRSRRCRAARPGRDPSLAVSAKGTWIVVGRRRLRRAVAGRAVVLARAAGVEVDLEAIGVAAGWLARRRRRSRARSSCRSTMAGTWHGGRRTSRCDAHLWTIERFGGAC